MMITDKNVVRQAFSYLASRYNERAVEVMHMRFFHDMILRDIGSEIGISQERVRQIEAKSLRILKKFMMLRVINSIEEVL